ncbi:MAG: PIN domain-containing protein [Dissulfurispiraceae bacterium]|jgi:predicted ribonuclease YlaK
MNTTATSTIYVLDTSALVEDALIINNLQGRVIIPAVVIRQLDGLKNNQDNGRANAARRASQAIETAVMNNKAEICHGYEKVEMLDSVADNKIVGTALLLDRKHDGKVVLVATDRNMRIASMSFGIEVHKGMIDVEPTDEWLRVNGAQKDINNRLYQKNNNQRLGSEEPDWFEQIGITMVKALKFMGAMLIIALLVMVAFILH